MSSGRTVELRRGRAHVTVDPAAGGRVTALTVDGQAVLGGSGNPAIPSAMRQGCFPMVPFAGRIERGRVQVGEESWTMPANLGDSAAHGVAFDVPWAVEAVEDDAVHLVVDLDRRWPFGGTARESVRVLDDGVEIVLSVENESRSMPAALGLHPWFARGRRGTDAVVEVAADGREDLPPRPWDLCLTGLTDPPTASWPDARLVVECDTDTWTVYEQDPDAFCLEPLTHPVGAVATGDGADVGPGRRLELTARFRIVDGPGR